MALDKANSGNAAIEFHDTEVGVIEQGGTTLTIEFSHAYVHRSEGIPGMDAGTGWVQGAVMVLSGCQFSGEFPKLPCSLSDGYVDVGSEAYNSVIPVPLIYVGDTRVNLSFEDGSKLQVTANGLRLDTVGDPTYVEEFSGQNDV